MERDELLLRITRCPELAKARLPGNHPCSTIVSIQTGSNPQVPEPWSGRIDTALLLFISSNPSISDDERFPTRDWDAQATSDFFQKRFDPDAGYVDARSYNKVRFWTSVRARAKELFQREVVPGCDFAITEVVHCKSRGEAGVREALHLCSQRWLSSVLSQSSAPILILLGNHAKEACSQLWQLDSSRTVNFNVPVSGINRAVVALPHPNARRKRKIADHVDTASLARLRTLMCQQV